jgi:hypothetical protein
VVIDPILLVAVPLGVAFLLPLFSKLGRAVATGVQVLTILFTGLVSLSWLPGLLSGKLAAIFGLAVFGLLQYHVGLRYAILLCAVLFLLAWLVSLPVNETRGRRVAEQGG